MAQLKPSNMFEFFAPTGGGAKIADSAPIAEVAKTELVSAPIKALNDNEQCLQILDALKIDLTNGTNFRIDYLLSIGFIFNAYSKIEQLYNIPAGHKSHCLVYGKYKLYLQNNEIILIAKNSNN